MKIKIKKAGWLLSLSSVVLFFTACQDSLRSEAVAPEAVAEEATLRSGGDEIPSTPVPLPREFRVRQLAPNVFPAENKSAFGSSNNLYDFAPQPKPINPDDNWGWAEFELADIRDNLVEISRKIPEHKRMSVFSESFVFDRSNDQLFVGNVVQGDVHSAHGFTPLKGAVVQPVRLSTTLIADGEPNLSVVMAPALSTYRDALAMWKAKPTKPSPTRTITEVHELKSNTEWGYNGGLELSREGFSLINSLMATVSKNETKLLVKFVQSNYSVGMDNPIGSYVKDFDRIAFYRENRTMPLYISNIEYGRIYYILITSKYSATEVKAAFKLNATGADGNTNAFSDFFYKKVREASDVKLAAIGGTAMDHGTLISDGWEAFRRTLSNHFDPTTAEPVAVGLRFVDNNAPAKMVFGNSTPQTETIAIPTGRKLRLRFKVDAIQATSGFAEIGKTRFYGKGEILFPSGAFIFGGRRKELMSLRQSEYLSVVKGAEEWSYLDTNAHWVAVDIHLPRSVSSLERYLNRTVQITFENRHSSPWGGSSTGLGKRTIEMTVGDLIFASLDGGFIIGTRENRLIDYMASVRVSMQPFEIL